MKDAELTGDTGNVNAVSDDTQKVWEICEAPEAEMTTQSEKEGMIVIAVEEKSLQGMCREALQLQLKRSSRQRRRRCQRHSVRSFVGLPLQLKGRPCRRTCREILQL